MSRKEMREPDDSSPHPRHPARKEITIGDAELTLSLEASNLLNAGTVLERELDLGTGCGTLADEMLASRVFRMQVRRSW